MKQKALRFSSIAAGIAFLAVFFGAAVNNTPATNAISTADFKAGNIIDDAVFYNKNTMTVEDIQAHLNRYMPTCDTWGTGPVGSGRYINGRAIPASTTRADYARQMREAGKTRYHEPPYICVQNYYENPTTHETLYDTKNVIKEGMISAAQIIYDAAQKYNVNPQVLLVLLKKESYVWGDNWPLKDEYDTVMGYACPDNAPCDTKYFGFYNQVETSAWQLNYYKEHIYSYNYRPYATNYILYSPDASCGRKEVYLENLATTSLYIYTPYTPNDAALRNYPGTATCGSYGNRNFFMYFAEWFGDTHSFNAEKKTIPSISYTISDAEAKKTLAIADNSKNAGAKLIAVENNGSVFEFKSNSDKSYTIINSTSNMVLDVPGGSAMVGAEIQQWTSNSTPAQRWYIYSDSNGGYSIASALSPSYVLAINEEGKIILDIYGSQNSKPLSLKPVVNEKVKDGTYVLESALKENLVLDLGGNSNAEGANINMYAANDTVAQDYVINFDEKTGYYVIKSNHNKVLTASGTTIKAGSNIQANTDKAECTQRFLIVKDEKDNYTFYSSCDLSFAIDVAGGAANNGTNVQIWTSNNTSSQQWRLKEKKAVVEETPVNEEPTPEPEEQKKQPLEDGNYVIHSALRSDYVVDIAGGSTANGANIQMWAKNNTVAQIFNLKYNAEIDAYLIVNPHSNHAVDLLGASTKSGTNIHAHSVNYTCAQYWKIKKKDNGNFAISSFCSDDYVLDVAGGGTSSGTNLWLYATNNTKAQEWSFEKK